MIGEIAKGALQGINEGINKSPFPNPVGNTIQGVQGIGKGLKNFKKKQLSEQNKNNKALASKQKVVAKENALKDKQKRAEGKEYLGKLKAKLEGNKAPNLNPKKPAMVPSSGVVGQVGYKPAQPNLPKVSSGKLGKDFIKSKQAEGKAAIGNLVKPNSGFKPNTNLPKVHVPKKPTVGLSEDAVKKKLGL